MKTVRDYARSYIARGLCVVPNVARGKQPYHREWQTLRITESEVESFFKPTDNIGIETGEPSGNVVCVDLDSEVARKLAPLFLPATPIVCGRTTNPEGHRFYRIDCDQPGRKWKLSKEDAERFGFANTVELLATGQQVVVGPSIHETGDVYHAMEGEPATVTADELIAACVALDIAVRAKLGVVATTTAKPERNGHTSQPPVTGDRETRLKRAAAYLVKIQPAVSGQGGHAHTFSTAIKLASFGLSRDDVFDLLSDWNRACEPPWTEAELWHKIDDALKADVEPMEDRPRTAGTRRESGPSESSQPNDQDREPTHGASAIVIRWAGDLIDEFPEMSPAILEGLLRCGETMNIIAAPKTGKSWLSMGLGLSVVSGRKWLGRFWTRRGKVLLVDNELYPQTSAHRLPWVAKSMGIQRDEYAGRLGVVNLRGQLIDLKQLALQLLNREPGEFDLIILDAWYRFQPAGSDENSNGDVAQLYNLLDSLAAKLGSAFICIHHNSKGNQSGKGVTDVGAGAGAQSRAADSHLTMRLHETDNAVVVEAAVRSFAPMEPFCLRWNCPVWSPADDLDPKDLRQERPRKAKGPATESGESSEDARQQRDQEARQKVLDAYATFPDGETPTVISAAAGMNWKNFMPIHSALLREGIIQTCQVQKSTRSFPGAKLVTPTLRQNTSFESESECRTKAVDMTPTAFLPLGTLSVGVISTSPTGATCCKRNEESESESKPVAEDQWGTVA